jgi:large subunit ribosomal protein L25
MSTIVLVAEARKDIGKGASRRLRRLEKKIPGIIYGGDKKPESIHIPENKLNKALEDESIYSSVFSLEIDGKAQQVILKDLQRHPYRPIILHLDLQRVGAKDVLVKHVPLHFINEENAKGVKAGGIISHTMNQVEVRCQAQHLPEFIEVDMAKIELNDVVHLSHLKLPKGVKLSVDVKDGTHDLPVVSIHTPRVSAVEEEVEEVTEVDENAAAKAPTSEPEQPSEDKSAE